MMYVNLGPPPPVEEDDRLTVTPIASSTFHTCLLKAQLNYSHLPSEASEGDPTIGWRNVVEKDDFFLNVIEM